jgi:hypothetical protein
MPSVSAQEKEIKQELKELKHFLKKDIYSDCLWPPQKVGARVEGDIRKGLV